MSFGSSGHGADWRPRRIDTPARFRQAGCPLVVAGTCPPRPSDYAHFAYNLALRYAERRTPILIEVWNEPDGAFTYQYPARPLPPYCAPGTISRTACEYSRLVQYLKRSLLTGDRCVRRTPLVVGALSSTSTSWRTAANWIRDMYRNGALASATALSFHLFPQTSGYRRRHDHRSRRCRCGHTHGDDDHLRRSRQGQRIGPATEDGHSSADSRLATAQEADTDPLARQPASHTSHASHTRSSHP